MNKEQLYKDLVKEYDELNEKINSLDAFINSLDFEEQVHDFIERELLRGKRHCMRSYRDNLKARIKYIEYQIKKEENDRKTLDDWMKMKGQVSNKPIHLVNTDEQPIEIKTQHEPTFDKAQIMQVCAKCDKPLAAGSQCVIHGNQVFCTDCGYHHCGQDATRCAEPPVIAGDSLKDLIDALVIAVDRTRCDKCPLGIKCPDANCVKVELVGGYYLCLMEKGGEK